MVRIKKMNILLLLLWVAIFPIYLPIDELSYIYQMIVAAIIFVFTIYDLKLIPNLSVLLYPVTICISCLVNKNEILIINCLKGFSYALLCIDCFLLVYKYIQKKGTKELFITMLGISKFYFIVNLIWTIFLIITNKLSDAIQNGYLMLGGKFTSSYMLIFFLMFYYINLSDRFTDKVRKRNKFKFIILSILCIVLCALYQTATGIVAIVLFSLITLFGKNILKIFNHPFAVILFVVLSMVAIFLLSSILNINFVKYIIVHVLHEDLTLTGRLELYKLLLPLLKKASYFGFGFGSYVTTRLGYHGWYDSQNGLAEIILTYGYVGCVSFLILIFTCIKKSKIYFESLNAALLIFIIIAIVEIPFNSKFIFLLAILMFSKKDIGNQNITTIAEGN